MFARQVNRCISLQRCLRPEQGSVPSLTLSSVRPMFVAGTVAGTLFFSLYPFSWRSRPCRAIGCKRVSCCAQAAVPNPLVKVFGVSQFWFAMRVVSTLVATCFCLGAGCKGTEKLLAANPSDCAQAQARCLRQLCSGSSASSTANHTLRLVTTGCLSHCACLPGYCLLSHCLPRSLGAVIETIHQALFTRSSVSRLELSQL